MTIKKINPRTLLGRLLFLSILLITPSLHAGWTAINDLVAEQQYSAAKKQIDRRLLNAKAAKNTVEWTRALVELTKLRFERSEYEVAVQFLRDQQWPNDVKSQVMLSLYYADAISKYISHYSWRINSRESVKNQGKLPVEKMTMAQLVDEADQAYLKAWQGRAHWRNAKLEQFPYYFKTGDYPARVRGSFLDTLAYLWVDFLANEQHWTPAQANKKSVLKAGQLLNMAGQQAGVFTNRNAHPLKRISALLHTLAQQYQRQNRPEAALEARRVQIDTLYQHVSATSEQHVLRQALRQHLQAGQALPWSTMLQWSLAQLEQGVDQPDALIRAKAVLDLCVARHKGSEGNKRCQSLLAKIMQPSFDMETMASDDLHKRSIMVQHKNVDKLYLRAWRMTMEEFIRSRAANYDEQNKVLKKYLAQNKTDAAWTVDLPVTRNYRRHKTFVTPPMQDKGMWLIAAADEASFAPDKTITSSVYLNLTGLVADVKPLDDALLVTAYGGATGRFVPGADVQIRDTGNKTVAQAKTDQRGRARLTVRNNQNYTVVVRDQGDSTLIQNINNYRYDNEGSKQVERSLIFTDRSIYRPGQKLQWKVMAYQGDAGKSDFRAMAGQKGWVKLLDAHGTEVEQQTITTNGFGSAAGSFILKSGVPLGDWRLQTSWGGNRYLKVEEYKRPTFKVEFNDAKQTLYLNRKATITATATYLFGSPVTDAEVAWRVQRFRDYSHYPYWRRPYDRSGSEMVASGTAKPDNKGLIKIGFVPKPADEQENSGSDDSAVYRFQIEADVTDSGGETRSTSRNWRIGNTAIKAAIDLPVGFVEAGKSAQFTFTRSDLNDVPRAGQANWTLYRIKQEATVLPADAVVKVAKDELPYATAGDKLLPRWAQQNAGASAPPWARRGASGYDVDVALRKLTDGQAINRGVVRHDVKGQAVLKLKPLPAGLYRLHYQTRDTQGKVFDAQQELVVASVKTNAVRVPLMLKLKQSSVEVGKSIEMLVGSGFDDTPVVVDIYQGSQQLRSNVIGGGVRKINFPVNKTHRGGLRVVVSGVRDYQHFTMSQDVAVPWTDRKLDVSFSTFRDRLKPGQKETWRVTVKDLYSRPLPKGASEIVAGMYDKSLDFFAAHNVFNIKSLYNDLDRGHGSGIQRHSQGSRDDRTFSERPRLETVEVLNGSRLTDFNSQLTHSHPAIPGVADVITHSHKAARGGKHTHRYSARRPAPKPAPKPAANYKAMAAPMAAMADASAEGEAPQSAPQAAAQPDPATIRTNFNETAFFYPNLILGDNGSVIFEFEVPESLTEWKVWATALTRDLRGGSAVETTRTSKDLMVRPYLPRFLREGDQAEIAVVINNTSEQSLSGQLSFDIIDPDSKQSRAAEFKLNNAKRNFQLKAGASVTLRYPIDTPKNPGLIAIRTQAAAGNLSDGELRPLAILPSRMHLMESQFAVVNNNEPETLSLLNIAQNNDPTRQHEKLVVNVEGQLFYSVLNALPYLVEYPYECTEQTLNRYLSTSIVKSVFDRNPVVAAMAKQLATRNTRLEQWTQPDANRSLLLEETPWLSQAQGGQQATDKLFNILNNQVATKQREDALGQLLKAQREDGGFPWWAGGPASPTMTLYQLQGFARALEFGQDAPKSAVQQAWKYLHNTYKDKILTVGALREITMLSYLLTAYPDRSWTGPHFSGQQQANMLNFAFQNRGKLSRQLKLYLAMALHRTNRKAEADRVLAAVMDGAITDKRLGTYWKPDRRSWLWYYDNTVSHALTLRALTEMTPNDPRRSGLAQWLLLDKKMNHWKSTRATAESIYALVHYLKNEPQSSQSETATIQVGPNLKETMVFKPTVYNGKQQLVVQGADITPAMQKITVSKQGGNKLPIFASATWHYSTDKIPTQAQGDFLQVQRRFYKRVLQNGKWTLQPLQAGAAIKIGDQVEVRLTVGAKHTADYVHLRSPRGAGFEPVEQLSGYRWQNGVGYYAEIRDSGANYFFEQLPVGERELRYRLRATTAGQFRVAPATLQSIYAPEFTAYSRGMRMGIR